jgi:transposase
MRAHSLDLRQRVLADCDRGQGTKAVATKYGVSPAWARRLKQRRWETGEIGPRKLGPPKGGRLAAHHDRLRVLNAARPDATPVELRDALGLPVSIRRYGRCPRDQRLVAKVPHGHWKTTTFLAALRHDGLYAPLVIDGAITGDLFRAYVQQQLVSTLQPGDLLQMRER